MRRSSALAPSRGSLPRSPPPSKSLPTRLLPVASVQQPGRFCDVTRRWLYRYSSSTRPPKCGLRLPQKRIAPVFANITPHECTIALAGQTSSAKTSHLQLELPCRPPPRHDVSPPPHRRRRVGRPCWTLRTQARLRLDWKAEAECMACSCCPSRREKRWPSPVLQCLRERTPLDRNVCGGAG